MKTESKPKYDLEERTAVFGEKIILLTKGIKPAPLVLPLLDQLVRSATSIGANYCEANNAESRMDFKHKLGICRKESNEAKHWLRMLATSLPEKKEELRVLWQEANELNLIFNAIVHKLKNNGK